MTPFRKLRQQVVQDWCIRAFGRDHATSLPQRAIRLLEEAAEAFQAAGGDPAMAHRCIDVVFSRPVGKLGQELGGIGVTLLALAEAGGLDADAEEQRELDRVLARPIEEFTRRNQEKNALGLNTAVRLS
jgi:hypothetical protein